MTIPPNTPIPCLDCGAVYCLTVRELHDGDEIVASAFVYPDGSTPRDYDLIRCRACGSLRIKWLTFEGR